MRFQFAEKRAAEALGVNQAEFHAARAALREGRDWKLLDGAILYCEAGLERAVAMLLTGKPSRKALGVAMAAPAMPELLAAADVTVWRDEAVEALLDVVGTCRNRKMVRGALDGRPMRIRVRDNGRFRAGMQIPCRLIEGDYWEFIGRAPKTRRSYWQATPCTEGDGDERGKRVRETGADAEGEGAEGNGEGEAAPEGVPGAGEGAGGEQ